MIRLTRCTQADKAGTYFRLHLMAGDNQAHPAAPSPTLRARWTGSALGDVALVQGNQPERSHLVRLCRGLHPTQKVRLAPSVNRKRAYYDVLVAAPKTVSLAALLIPNHVVARWIMGAHLKAVEEVAAALSTMLQPQSKTAPPVAAWLGASFHHTHSREGDPHLHTHHIFPNIMRNVAGQWRAMQINIAGTNRTRLSLIYKQALTGSLRRLGFTREDLMIRPDGTPEFRVLLPLIKRFSKAQHAVLAAAAAEAAHPVKDPPSVWKDFDRVEFHSRSQMPIPANKAALQRRRRLADRIRRPKPKDADDPVRLIDEASRWHRALENQEFRTLTQLLDDLDPTNPKQRKRAAVKPAPAAFVVVQRAFVYLCTRWQRCPSESLLLQGAVAFSAGRHGLEELEAACKARLAAYKIGHAKVMKRIRAEFVVEEEATMARSRGGQTISRVQPAPTPPASGPSTNSAPSPTPTNRGVPR